MYLANTSGLCVNNTEAEPFSYVNEHRCSRGTYCVDNITSIQQLGNSGVHVNVKFCRSYKNLKKCECANDLCRKHCGYHELIKFYTVVKVVLSQYGKTFTLFLVKFSFNMKAKVRMSSVSYWIGSKIRVHGRQKIPNRCVKCVWEGLVFIVFRVSHICTRISISKLIKGVFCRSRTCSWYW